ncbi:MAG: septal ring lytic transglycosylase RlpA family protein [Desulfobacteraceae bacterium]|nr:septal ring lytic transglycosylase RlpA family protein [Desulfobacteraceae bacterium]
MKYILILTAAVFLILTSGCASSQAPRDIPHKSVMVKKQTGLASYYSSRLHGCKTASGEYYDETNMTAAHRTYKFGTRLKVTNLSNNRTVIVRVNDRGPFVKGRIIDLSRKAAEQVGMIKQGVVRVRIEVIC